VYDAKYIGLDVHQATKQAAIRTLEEQGIQANLPEHGQSGGHEDKAIDPNLLKQNGGPGRIRATTNGL
jgi:hypothetical protein